MSDELPRDRATWFAGYCFPDARYSHDVRCQYFHGPDHGDLIDDLYHDCEVHHDHEGADKDCPYYFVASLDAK